MENLRFIIIDLISLKREGEYWDFKVEPHQNNASLLHDLLCLANCNHKGDRYLIIGVSDPHSFCEIKRVFKGQLGRKGQNHLIDFLRNIRFFAGDYCPEVELQTIEIEGKEVDIINSSCGSKS